MMMMFVQVINNQRKVAIALLLLQLLQFLAFPTAFVFCDSNTTSSTAISDSAVPPSSPAVSIAASSLPVSRNRYLAVKYNSQNSINSRQAIEYTHSQASTSSSSSSAAAISSSQLIMQSVLYKNDNGSGDDTCPPCFNCMLTDYKCINSGQCSPANGRCTCTAGFGGDNCGKPLCGGLSDPPSQRLPVPDNQSQCQCKPGWAGINCNICTQDDVCDRIINPDSTSDINGTCYRDTIPIRRIYSDCSIENKMLKMFLGSNTARASINCDRSERTCDFQFWVNNIETFYCEMGECESEANAESSANFTTTMCKSMNCGCIKNTFLCTPEGDNVDLSEMLAAVTGPATMQCRQPGFDSNRYNCQFKEPTFAEQFEWALGASKSIELKCMSGQCLHYSEVPGFIPPAKPSPYGTIFTVVGSVLVVCVVLFSFGYRYLKKYKRRQLYNAYHAETDSVDDELEKLMESGHHVPATLVFRNISYEIPVKSLSPLSTTAVNASNITGRKRVLRGIYGIVRPGEVMAIMGSSGAGKTTCLDILAGKTKRGIVSGDLLINGKVPTREQFKRISGYVDQEESLMGTLTVYETLLYSALLRLPRAMSRQAKEKRVRDTMTELGIEHIANSKIGTAGKRGISGGEKRRVSIAMEVVTSPSILYLDEPTSGLDSYNALSVVQALVTLARRYQRTVILTIHQPRSNIFRMFDRLLLLAEGGYMVYSGPIISAPSPVPTAAPLSGAIMNNKGSGVEQQQSTQSLPAQQPILLNWLAELGIQCPTGFNLADYLIDVTKTGGFEQQITSTTGEDGSGADISRYGTAYRRMKPTGSYETNSSSSVSQRSPFPIADYRTINAPPAELLERLQAAEEHIAIHQRDLDEMKPHLRHLVMGFARSSVGQLLKQSIVLCLTDSSMRTTEHDNSNNNLPTPGPPVDSEENAPLLQQQQQQRQQQQLPPQYDQLFTSPNNMRYDNDGDGTGSEGMATAAATLDARMLAAIRRSINTLLRLSIPRQTTRPTFTTQFQILSRRTFANFYRNPLLMWGHYGISIVLALICGMLFWQVTDDLSGFQSRLGIFFFLFAVFGFSSLSSLELFAKERTMFMRERANGFYGVSVYYLTKIMFDMLPLRVVPPLLLGSIAYYMIGLYPPVENFFKFLLVLVLFNLTASSLCLVIAAICGANLAAANLIGVMTMLFNMLFGGFLINKVHIPGWLSWLQYLSFYNYAFEAVLVNELEEISLEDRKVGIPIQIPGPLILDTLGFKTGNYWPDVISLIWMFIAFLALGFVILQVYVKERR